MSMSSITAFTSKLLSFKQTAVDWTSVNFMPYSRRSRNRQ